MARGINKAIVVGHVCNSPSLSRKTHGVYLKAIVATNGRQKNPVTFLMEDCTDYHTVVIPHPLAEVLEPMIKKGTLLYVEGEMKTLKAKHTRTGLMQNFPQINATNVQVQSRRPNHAVPPGDDHHSTSSPSPYGNSLKGGGEHSGLNNE